MIPKAPSLSSSADTSQISRLSKYRNTISRALGIGLMVGATQTAACVTTILTQSDGTSIVLDGSDLDDREDMLDAIEANSYAFRIADRKLQSDPSFIMDAIKRNYKVIVYLHESWRNHPEHMFEGIKHDARLYPNIGDELKGNKDFQLRLIKLDAEHLGRVPPELWNDLEFMARVMEINILALAHLNNKWRNHGGYMDGLIKIDPRAYAFVGDGLTTNGQYRHSKRHAKFRKNKDIMRLANIAGTQALRLADKTLVSDLEFMLEIVKENPDGFQYVDESIRGDERLLRAYLGSKTKSKNKVEYLIKALKRHNIKFPERFSIKTLEKLIEERENITVQDSRRVALAVYSTRDWNQALVEPAAIKDAIDAGFRTLYFEASNEKEVYSAIQSSRLTERLVKVLILGAHGNRTGMSYGAGDPRFTRRQIEQKTIDTGDGKDLKKYRAQLADLSSVILHSCSVGKGRLKSNNVANTLLFAFPQAIVFSSTIPTNIKKVHFGQGGIVTGVDYTAGNQFSYFVRSAP